MSEESILIAEVRILTWYILVGTLLATWMGSGSLFSGAGLGYRNGPAALYRDRARIQVGRISMFGLLELSRQRLRSSLIEKSFDKCYFCKGSGLILNSKSISEQILNVIKEKLIVNNNSSLLVKCNSSLAENLINQKKHELNSLENNYKSIITFEFKEEISLHEPIIEVSNSKKNEEKTSIKKNSENIKKKSTKIKIKDDQKKITKTKKSASKKKRGSKKDEDLKVKNIEKENLQKIGRASCRERV